MSDSAVFLGCPMMPMSRLSKAELKFAFLWFDQVYFDPFSFDADLTRMYISIAGMEGIGMRRSDFHVLTDVFVPFWRGRSISEAKEFVEHHNRIYDDNGGTFAQEEAGPVGNAHHATVRHLMKMRFEHGFAWEWEEAVRAARGGILTTLLWKWISEPRPMTFLCKPTEEVAVEMLLKSEGGPAGASPEDAGELLLPDLTWVSWRVLVQAKRNSALQSLKRRIVSVSAGASVSEAQRAFADLVASTEDELLEGARPRPFYAGIRGLLTNLPIPPINPLALLDSAYNLARETTRMKDSGWLYLLRDLRRAAERPTPRM